MEDANDLTHDVFLRYFQNIDRFRHESNPSTWMYRVAVNLGILRWRKDRSRFLKDQDLDLFPTGSSDNEMALLDRITLTKIMGRYPENTQKIAFLHHVEKMTQVDIGKSLGLSRATVIRHLIHFRNSSRDYLAKPARTKVPVPTLVCLDARKRPAEPQG